MPARYSDGYFRGSLVTRCRLTTPTDPRLIADLAEVTREELARRLRPGTVLSSKDSVTRVFRGSEQVEEGLLIRQLATLETRDRGLKLEMESEGIEGSGKSAYLKGLRVKTSLAPLPGRAAGLELEIESGLVIERPWYAPAPIFARVAEGKAEEKFEAMRDRVLDEYTARISRAKQRAAR